jgi:hypothetical protein
MVLNLVIIGPPKLDCAGVPPVCVGLLLLPGAIYIGVPGGVQAGPGVYIACDLSELFAPPILRDPLLWSLADASSQHRAAA